MSHHTIYKVSLVFMFMEFNNTVAIPHNIIENEIVLNIITRQNIYKK